MDVKHVLTHFDFYLNVFFNALCPKFEISM